MTWIQTYTGRAFDYAQPKASAVNIQDIAHALSHLCRFAGHTHRFYSVAEHSVYVSRQVPREFALQGLLHDAVEAYVVDLPKPLKDLIPAYQMYEAAAWSAVAYHFGLPHDLDECVKAADTRLLLAERDQLLGAPPHPWQDYGVQPAALTIRAHNPAGAKLMFLDRFYELTKG